MSAAFSDHGYATPALASAPFACAAARAIAQRLHQLHFLVRKYNMLQKNLMTSDADMKVSAP
jgi:hypothetical protein